MQVFKKIGPYKKKIVIFFVILIVLLLLLSQLFTWLAGSGIYLTERNRSTIGVQAEEKDTLDVLFVGDSLNYCTFSPMEIWNDSGIPSYVCGQSGQRMQESYYLLKTSLRRQNPKLVVLETAVLFRPQEGVDGIKTTLGEMKNYYFPILRFHDIWKNLMPIDKTMRTDYKGHENRTSVEPYYGGEYMVEDPETQPPTDMVLYYFDKCLKLCADRDIPVLLVSVPSQDTYNMTMHNMIQEIAVERGLEYLDMNLSNDLIGIDWTTDTADVGEHLNLSGSTKATDFMTKYLQSHYDMVDHRDEAKYQSWNNLYQLYVQDISTPQ